MTGKRSSKWLWLALALLIAFAIAGCSDSDGSEEPQSTTTQPEATTTTQGQAETTTTQGGTTPSGEPVVFGALLDGSGGASFYSQETVAGIEIAVDEINASGGIMGRPVELLKEDDGNDANQAPAKVRSLIEDGAMAILQTSGSASSLQIKSVLVEEQIPGIAATNLNGSITKEPDESFMFATANSAGAMVTVLQEAMSEYSTAAIYTDTSPTGTGLADVYKASLEAVGIEVLTVEAVDVGATDATAQVARMRDGDPEAAFIAAQAPSEEALFVRTVQDLGWDVPIFMDITAGVPEFWELSGPAALEPVRYVDQADPDNERTQEFRSLFEERYDRQFVSFSAMGYDAVYILKEAIERAGTTDGPALRDALEQTDHEAHWGQPGYRVVCSATDHRCEGIEGMLVRRFAEDGTPGDVIYRGGES